MPGYTVSFEELQKLFKYDEPHQVIACLKENKIPFKKGKHGRPWTTIQAMNYSMGISELKSPTPEKIEF